MVQNRSFEELKDWLSDKPRDWIQIIAARAAIRALPFIDQAGATWLRKSALLLWRANVMAWAGRRPSKRDYITANNVYQVAIDAMLDAEFHGVSQAADAAANAYAATDTDYIGDAVRYAAYAPQDAARAAADEALQALFWDCSDADCRWLQHNENLANAAQMLSRQSLWHGPPPSKIASHWHSLQQKLRTIDARYVVWFEWYNRRITGESAGFDIPGDTDGRENQQILMRLAEASNEDFWDRGAEHVNASLQYWLDEARARSAPPVSAILPSQNPNAITFRQAADGKIAIDTRIDLNALQTDPDARDRHAELRRLSTALLARCQGSNAGVRLTGFLENYIEALGDSNESQRPSLLVQRGNRLDVERKASGDPATLLDPLADDVLLDLGNLVSAHNMHVMSEPVLRDRATAMLGPDAKPVLISPDEIKAVVQEADEQGILATGVRDVVAEAADIAPAVPDPENRFTIWSTETVTNLIIEAFSIALRHPVEAAIVGGVATVLPTGLDLGTAVIATGYLIHRRTWIEAKLANSPTWKALFIDLCNRMGKFIPPNE